MVRYFYVVLSYDMNVWKVSSKVRLDFKTVTKTFVRSGTQGSTVCLGVFSTASSVVFIMEVCVLASVCMRQAQWAAYSIP